MLLLFLILTHRERTVPLVLIVLLILLLTQASFLNSEHELLELKKLYDYANTQLERAENQLQVHLLCGRVAVCCMAACCVTWQPVGSHGGYVIVTLEASNS